MQDFINLSNFSLIQWTALFYVFVISRFMKLLDDHDHLGTILLISTSRFSGVDRWDVFFESMFFLGHFLAFLFSMLMSVFIATLLLVLHWLISDHFGYRYELTSISIYAGFIWAAASLTNASDRAIHRSQEEAVFWRQKAINLEDQIKSDNISK